MPNPEEPAAIFACRRLVDAYNVSPSSSIDWMDLDNAFNAAMTALADFDGVPCEKMNKTYVPLAVEEGEE